MTSNVDALTTAAHARVLTKFKPPRPPTDIFDQGINDIDELKWIEDEANAKRLYLSLRSRLPNEVDWALQKLGRISFVIQQWPITQIPFLLEALVQQLLPFFDSLTANDLIDDEMTRITAPLHSATSELRLKDVETILSVDARGELERITQTLFVLRNFALALDYNARCYSQNEDLIRIIGRGLALSPLTPLLEIRAYCMDLFECIAPNIELGSSENPFIDRLKSLLFENDRFYVLGALTSLAKLFGKESNENVLSGVLVEKQLIIRLFDLILVDKDHDLVHSSLDLLRLLSYLGPTACANICKMAPRNGISHLVSLFCKTPGDPLTPVWSFEPPASFMERLAKSRPIDSTPIVWGLQQNRAREWLNASLENDQESHSVALDEVYTSYLKYCDRQNVTNLKMDEFARILQATLEGHIEKHGSKSRVHGVRWKSGLNPKLNNKFLSLDANMDDVSSMDASSVRSDVDDSLSNVEDYLISGDDQEMSNVDAPNIEESVESNSLFRIPQIQLEDVETDLKPHEKFAKKLYGDHPLIGTSPAIQAFKSLRKPHDQLPEIGDSAYNAAIILRNLARSTATVPYLAPLEKDLVIASMYPPLVVYATSILAELDRSSK